MPAPQKPDVIRFSAVALNQTPLDWNGNSARIIAALEALKASAPEIVLFPELAVTGYGCEDAFYGEDVAARALERTRSIATASANILPESLILVGLPVRFNERIYNCLGLIQKGKVIGIVPKQNLAGDGIHYEQRWFTAWRLAPQTIRISETEIVPIGPLVADLGGVRIAFEICEDCWVPNRPADHYADASPDIILCPSASHFAFAKQDVRRTIALDSARSFGCIYAMINLVGNEAGRAIYDGCAIVASPSGLLYEGRRFSYEDFHAHTVDLDLSSVRTARSRLYSLKEQSGQSLCQILDLSIDRSIDRSASKNSLQIHAAETGKPENLSKEEEFLRAVALGLFDYLRKSHSRGYVISLSGGADSAACAVLVQRMFLFAIRELGWKVALIKLGLEKLISELEADVSNSSDPAAITRIICKKLLHTLYQGTKQSGSITEIAAQKVAAELGADHHVVSVEDLVGGYIGRAESILERTLAWETDDLSLQNIQARVRSPMVWLLANTTGSLLIATSNRSEGSVGYCTMDGDTSGGIAPIAGIDKDYLRKWLRWMEKDGDAVGGKLASLSFINNQEPTAELRPGQTDESDLMPYELLNQIEALAIRDKRSPLEIYRSLSGNWERLFLKKSIARFFRLWAQNQWKRERMAPSFHLDDRNVDPRTWCRFPILSGGFAAELEELDSAGD
ncbi:MAG: NAD(+) synthase [Spirochaetia bacterium]|nr:NAD(+) synthase [Spirochaetia bacterium]